MSSRGGMVPVMSNNGCGTDFVLQQSGSQTVLRVVSQLSCHPVRQICMILLRGLSRERLIEVNRLKVKNIKADLVGLIHIPTTFTNTTKQNYVISTSKIITVVPVF